MEFNRNTLLLLRGLPASGKSTFIKKYRLQDYCVSYDEIRNIIGGARLYERGGLYTPQIVETGANKMVEYAMAYRMMSGDLVIIDSPFIYERPVLEGELRRIKDICDIYDYKLCYKQFDTPLEECLKRSKERSEREPFPQTIINMDKIMRENPMPSWVTKFEDIGYGQLGVSK